MSTETAHLFDETGERLVSDLRHLRDEIFEARHRDDLNRIRLYNHTQARILERYLDKAIELLKQQQTPNGNQT